MARTLTLLLLLLLAAGPARLWASEKNPLLLDSPREAVPALDFVAEALDGRQVRLSEFRGKVVLLNFWATWCVPCLLEMPSMDRLSRKLAGRPFTLLAVNQAEKRAQVEKFAREQGFSFDLLLDPIGEIGGNYGANRLPISYIIDRQGLVIRRAIGPREWDSPPALALFARLMESPPPPTVAPAAARSGP